MRYFAHMHNNTIDELLSQGEPKEKADMHFSFSTLQEAINFNFPYHRDNYILGQWDLNADEEGSILWEINMWELNEVSIQHAIKEAKQMNYGTDNNKI